MNAALDLGNSRLKLLRSDGAYAAWELPLLDQREIEQLLSPVGRIAVCSVNPSAERSLVELLGSRWELLDVRRAIAGGNLPFEVVADGVGADRILGVLGALRYADPPLVVFDFGTATTVTILDTDRRLVGGYIVPGIGLQLTVLRERLPHLSVPDSVVGFSTQPGSRTASAIGSGIVLETIAFVGMVVSETKTFVRTPHVSVIFTGGHVESLREALDRLSIGAAVVPHLVLEGALSLLEER
ncbi:MAG: type III pantothenate kinase [Chlorobi bacterium]|nr:type III pantothenate kinase [Chlorobiota bacterium]